MTKQIKLGLVSLGCSKNRVDSEQILGSFDGDDRFCLTQDLQEADAIIINTCAFIDRAKEESIEAILDCCALKKEESKKCVLVCGCLAERYREEIVSEIPEVDAVLGFGSIKEIPEVLLEVLNGKSVSRFDPLPKRYPSGTRHLTTPSHYAYIKIAEGCDNHCSYCAIPSIRGPYRSRSFMDICDEAHWLSCRGVRELIVIAQDTSYYGTDLYGGDKLPELLEELCKYPFTWIRVLYCYPERVTDRLLSVFAHNRNLLPYFDIPIQHCNNELLKRMNRKTTKEEIIRCIENIREKIPNATLRTTLITGFPGETEAQFEELIAFVKETRFERLGCFAYSQEEGTPAARMPGQIPQEIKERRAELVMLEQQRILDQLCEEKIGTVISTLVEGEEDGKYIGRSRADAPDIDGNVLFTSAFYHHPGELALVSVDRYENGTLFGHFQSCEKEGDVS